MMEAKIKSAESKSNSKKYHTEATLVWHPIQPVFNIAVARVNIARKSVY